MRLCFTIFLFAVVTGCATDAQRTDHLRIMALEENYLDLEGKNAELEEEMEAIYQTVISQGDSAEPTMDHCFQ